MPPWVGDRDLFLNQSIQESQGGRGSHGRDRWLHGDRWALEISMCLVPGSVCSLSKIIREGSSVGGRGTFTPWWGGIAKMKMEAGTSFLPALLHCGESILAATPVSVVSAVLGNLLSLCQHLPGMEHSGALPRVLI